MEKSHQGKIYRLCPICGFTSESKECPRCGRDLIGDDKTLVIKDSGLRGGFSQVPNVVLRNPLLSSNAVRLYCLLLSHAWQDRECFPGQDKLAGYMGCDRRTIARTLDELRKHKLINWKRRGQGKVNVYYIEKLTKGYLPKSFIDRGQGG